VEAPPGVTLVDGGAGGEHRQFVEVAVDLTGPEAGREIGVPLRSFDHVLFVWSSEGCRRKRRGALWLAALGAHSARRGALPRELDAGAWVSADPPSKARVWTQQAAPPALKVHFVPEQLAGSTLARSPLAAAPGAPQGAASFVRRVRNGLQGAG